MLTKKKKKKKYKINHRKKISFDIASITKRDSNQQSNENSGELIQRGEGKSWSTTGIKGNRAPPDFQLSSRCG